MSKHPSPGSDNDVERCRPADIALIEGEYGTARDLTDELIGEFGRRNIKIRKVPAARVAHRNLALPTVLATFVEGEPPIAYEGYGRIFLDFLPLLRTG